MRPNHEMGGVPPSEGTFNAGPFPTGGATGVVRSATYDEGYKAGLGQAVVELEAEATIADRAGLTGVGDYLRALADKMRSVRDR